MKMENKVEKNAIINVGSKIVTTALSLFSLIIITKRLGNTNYGTVVFCESIMTYFWLMASLGISDYAIREGAPVRDNKIKVNNLINRMFSLNIITSFIAFVLLLILVWLIKLSTIEKIIIIIFGIKVFFSAFELSWVYKLFEDYKSISIFRIIIEVFFFLFSFMFIHTPNDYIMFAVVSTGLDLFYCFLLYVGTKKYVNIRWIFQINIKECIQPIMIIFLSVIMVTLYCNTDITMLGFLRSSNEVGIYKVASKIYLTVAEMINSICIVSMPRISYYVQNNDNKSYNNLINMMFQMICIITIPAIIGIFCVCDNTILLIFGQQYIDSSSILKVLSLSLIFNVINKFFVDVILISFKKEKNIFIITAIGTLTNVILNYIFIPKYGPYGAAIATYISEILEFIIAYSMCRNMLLINNIFKNLLIALLTGSMILGICFIVSSFSFPTVIEIILQISLSVVMYFFAIIFLRRKNIIL